MKGWGKVRPFLFWARVAAYNYDMNTLDKIGIEQGEPRIPISATGGRAVPGSDPTWYEGMVSAVYPDKHTICVTLDGVPRPIEATVMPRVYDPVAETKEFALYKIGTPVFVTRAPGRWVCVGIAPRPRPSNPRKKFQQRLTPVEEVGADDPVYKHGGGAANYRGQGVRDIMPGDWGVMGSDGQTIGTLEGGGAILKAGELSQVIALSKSQWGELLKIVASNLHIFTDFGEIKSINEDGKTGIVINGYADASNANKHSGNWDYQIKLGGGKNLFSAKFGRAANGDALFAFVIDASGRGKMLSHQAFDSETGTSGITKKKGDTKTTYGGDKHDEVAGKKYSFVKGSVHDEASGGRTEMTSGAKSVQIQDNELKIVGTTKENRIGGVPVTATNPDAHVTTVAVGNHVEDIGNPKDLGVPAPILTGASGNKVTQVWNGSHHTVCGIGDVVQKTGGGNIVSQCGPAALPTTSNMVLTPTGHVKLGNGITGPTSQTPMEVVSILAQICQLLSTTTTPGYGGPISTFSQFGLLAADIQSFLKIQVPPTLRPVALGKTAIPGV